MWIWWLASNYSKKGKYIPGKVNNTMKEKFIKIGNLRVCWDLIQVNKFQISLIMTYHRAIWDVTFVSEKYYMTCKKIELLKKLHIPVTDLNKPHKSPRKDIFGVCKKILTKLKYYFFTIIYLGTASFEI